MGAVLKGERGAPVTGGPANASWRAPARGGSGQTPRRGPAAPRLVRGPCASFVPLAVRLAGPRHPRGPGASVRHALARNSLAVGRETRGPGPGPRRGGASSGREGGPGPSSLLFGRGGPASGLRGKALLKGRDLGRRRHPASVSVEGPPRVPENTPWGWHRGRRERPGARCPNCRWTTPRARG